MKRTPSENLDAMRAFLAEAGIEARFDAVTAALYSTDASNHQVTPLGVARPRHRDEVAAIVVKAAELAMPVLPRGAGTSLGGQAVGACLILDTARHLDRIRSIDADRLTAIVEPGVVCQTLNAAAAEAGLQYGPDPASADRATFGGMLGNNATGAHSIRYGMSSDHLVRASMVVGDGRLVEFTAVAPQECSRRGEGNSVEAAVHRTALDLRRTIAPEIEAHWPRTWRRASGYGLHYLTGQTADAPPAWYRAPGPYMDEDVVDIPGALCGSEGTLGILVEAEVRLVPRPQATVLLLLPFDSVLDACEATPALLEDGPSAIELVPQTLIERAQRVPAYARRLGFLEGAPRSILAVEFEGESPEAAAAAARRSRFQGTLLADPSAQSGFWEVRRAGLGLLMSVPGDVKPNTFIEDVAVPVGSLATYVRRVEAILREHGTTAEWYAHASAGCLHLRPMLNLKTDEGRRAMRRIAEAIVAVACELGGAVSGEHGDGLSHTEFNERLFGPALMDAFRRWKLAFDPKGIFNPGKVIPIGGEAPPGIDQQMRYGPAYAMRVPLDTHFAFAREQGLLRALESCSGVGVCRKAGGVMCPSFQATREESDSTRGRANALRAAMTGSLPPETLLRPEMLRVLDLCLECKGCKAECPTAVDMARIKAEYLSLYQSRHGTPLRSRLFGEINRLQGWAAPFAFVHERIRRTRLLRSSLEQVLGIDRRRSLPPIHRRAFASSVPKLERPPSGAKDSVVLFIDSFTDRNEPDVGRAARRLFEAAGLSVSRAAGQVCCGRPMISKGMLAAARRLARRNIDALAPFARAGLPIVGLEPSCLLTLRDEYLEFFPDDPEARAVAGATRLLEEILTDEDIAARLRPQVRSRDRHVLVHNHCHTRALAGSSAMLGLLGWTGDDVRESGAGCCGMAGSFGYEREHYDLSMRIGGMSLFPEVERAAAEGAVVVAPGMSCRTQVRDGTGVEAVHPAVYLAACLEGKA